MTATGGTSCSTPTGPACGQPQKGSDRYGVNDFLAFRDNEAAHQALMAALSSLFEGSPG